METHILLCGASGNLGHELAIRLSRQGVALSLWGRSTDQLSAVAGACEARGASIQTRSLDLTNMDAALEALRLEDDDHPFDIALMAAGLGDTLPQGLLVEDPAQVARLIQTNFTAPVTMASFLAARMAARGSGRIGLIGTAAASHSLPFAAGYAASKAGLARYADALRLAVRDHGVTVTLISPGFFAPRQSGNKAPSRPGEIDAGIVADRVIAALNAGRAEIVVPRRFLFLRWLDRLLPRFLLDRVLLSLRAP